MNIMGGGRRVFDRAWELIGAGPNCGWCQIGVLWLNRCRYRQLQPPLISSSPSHSDFVPCVISNFIFIRCFYNEIFITANVPSFTRLIDGIQKKKSRESMIIAVIVGFLLCITVWYGLSCICFFCTYDYKNKFWKFLNFIDIWNHYLSPS